MEINKKKIFVPKRRERIKKGPKFRVKKRAIKKIYKCLFLFVLIGLFLFLLYFNRQKRKKEKENLLNDKDEESISHLFNYSLKYEEFDEKINKKYIQFQNKFCERQNDSLIPEFEKRIILASADYYGKKFDMFVHNGRDYVSQSILYSHNWEGHLVLKLLEGLEYYVNKTKLEKKDIYVLDIGGNVGFYSFFLGKFGYKVLTFEASDINNYILYKNYCLNKDVNVTIINKGLDKDDRNCILRTASHNVGNGMIFCENREKNDSEFNGEIFNIEITKFSRYIKFLSNKNLAVIKIDVEGAEGNVIESGKELITKYHIPFIMTEFEVRMLEAHKTKVLEFLQFFENNGYKIGLNDFFDHKKESPLELIKNKNILNLFCVYEKFLE